MVLLHSPFQKKCIFSNSNRVCISDIFTDRQYLYVTGTLTSVLFYWNLNIWVGDFIRAQPDSINPYLPPLIQFQVKQNTFWAVYKIFSYPAEFDGLPLIIECSNNGDMNKGEFISYIVPLLNPETNSSFNDVKHVLIYHLSDELWKNQALPLAIHQWHLVGITSFIFVVERGKFNGLFVEMLKAIEEYYKCYCTVLLTPDESSDFSLKAWLYLLRISYSYKNRTMLETSDYILPMLKSSLNNVKSYVSPSVSSVKISFLTSDFYEYSPNWIGRGYFVPPSNINDTYLTWHFSLIDNIAHGIPIFPCDNDDSIKIDTNIWQGIYIRQRFQLVDEPNTKLQLSIIGDDRVPQKIKDMFYKYTIEEKSLNNFYKSDELLTALPAIFINKNNISRHDELAQLKILIKRQNLKSFLLIYPKSHADIAILELNTRLDAHFFILQEIHEKAIEDLNHPGIRCGNHLQQSKQYDLIWFLQSPSELNRGVFDSIFQKYWQVRHPDFVMGGVYREEIDTYWKQRCQEMSQARSWIFLQIEKFWVVVHPFFFWKLERCCETNLPVLD